jgi:galactose mutarotase-like enzyme
MAQRCPTELEKENVLIQAGDCSLIVAPHLGGKIASIKIKERELLQAPLAPPAPRTQTMRFDESDASGWDECLPSVAECTVEAAAGSFKIPDHGDLWRVEWETISENRNSVGLSGKCFSFPLTLIRTVELTEDDTGWHLHLTYRLTNTGSDPVPWSWAAHPLFAIEPGDRIVLPASVQTLRLEGSGGGRLGATGDTVAWPIATLADGSQTDLSIAQPPQSGVGDKLFAGPLAASENRCTLERPSAGLRIRFRFNTTATPYLGLWICYGGWPEGPGSKQNCVALEPCTAPVDSLAQSGPWSRVLPPGETFLWPMFVDIEST